MYVIQKCSYFKPYEDDTGFSDINSTPNLTAKIINPIQEIGIEIPLSLSMPIASQEEMIEMAEKSDYRPLLDSDPTNEF